MQSSPPHSLPSPTSTDKQRNAALKGVPMPTTARSSLKLLRAWGWDRRRDKNLSRAAATFLLGHSGAIVDSKPDISASSF